MLLKVRPSKNLEKVLDIYDKNYPSDIIINKYQTSADLV